MPPVTLKGPIFSLSVTFKIVIYNFAAVNTESDIKLVLADSISTLIYQPGFGSDHNITLRIMMSH